MDGAETTRPERVQAAMDHAHRSSLMCAELAASATDAVERQRLLEAHAQLRSTLDVIDAALLRAAQQGLDL